MFGPQDPDHHESDHDPLPPEQGEAPSVRELVLVKAGQRYLFRYEPGEEASMLARLRAMADDPEVELSWFDAAALSHQVGAQLLHRLEQRRSG